MPGVGNLHLASAIQDRFTPRFDNKFVVAAVARSRKYSVFVKLSQKCLLVLRLLTRDALANDEFDGSIAITDRNRKLLA